MAERKRDHERAHSTHGTDLSQGAQGVTRDRVGDAADAATRAHTRTMQIDGTTEFAPIDYRPPESTDTREGTQQVDSATAARLGHIAQGEGVSSLRSSIDDERASRSEQTRPKGHRTLVVTIVLIAVAVVLVGGAFMLFRSALQSVNDSSTSSSSARYATDSYVVLEQVDNNQLSCVYLVYVDSINGRSELCRIEGATSIQTQSTQAQASLDGASTLREAWDEGGEQSVASHVAALSGVELGGEAVVDASQMDEIISVASGAGDNVNLESLANAIAAQGSDSATLSASALRGMLITMADIGAEGYALLEAPYVDTDSDTGTSDAQTLDDTAWRTMVRGMRDPSADVSIG